MWCKRIFSAAVTLAIAGPLVIAGRDEVGVDALTRLKSLDVMPGYLECARSQHDRCPDSYGDGEWFSTLMSLAECLCECSDRDCVELREKIRDTLETSDHYPAIVALAKFVSYYRFETDPEFVYTCLGILSERVTTSSPEHQWNFVYAVEQLVSGLEDTADSMERIRIVLNAWRGQDFDEESTRQLAHLLFTLSGPRATYRKWRARMFATEADPFPNAADTGKETAGGTHEK